MIIIGVVFYLAIGILFGAVVSFLLEWQPDYTQYHNIPSAMAVVVIMWPAVLFGAVVMYPVLKAPFAIARWARRLF